MEAAGGQHKISSGQQRLRMSDGLGRDRGCGETGGVEEDAVDRMLWRVRGIKR